MQLTEQQVNFFETYGYLGLPGLMADRVDEIIREFEAVWAAHGGGHNGRPQPRSNGARHDAQSGRNAGRRRPGHSPAGRLRYDVMSIYSSFPMNP